MERTTVKNQGTALYHRGRLHYGTPRQPSPAQVLQSMREACWIDATLITPATGQRKGRKKPRAVRRKRRAVRAARRAGRRR